MYSVSSEQEISDGYLTQLRSATDALFGALVGIKESILLHATEDLLKGPTLQGYLYLVTEGSFSWCRDAEICFVIEQGDVIGFEECFGHRTGRYATEFAVRCDRYPLKDIMEQIAITPAVGDLWNAFHASRGAYINAHLLQAMRGEKQFTPEILSYHAGHTVIEQGTPGDKVYTLINGHAEVLVDGVSVGEVLCDEIFGALAALTDMPRTATVVTTQDSMVLSIPRENFLELVESRPATVLKMVQDMARTIVDLNKKVVEKSRLYR